MKVDTFQCDVCGAQKKETNHWWIVRTGKLLTPDGTITKPPIETISIIPWYVDMAYERSAAHLCGEKCVIAKVSEFLSK